MNSISPTRQLPYPVVLTRVLAIGAALLGLALAGPAAAPAAVSCQYEPLGRVLTVTLSAADDRGVLTRAGEQIKVLGGTSPTPVYCSGVPATVTNTDTITVTDSSGGNTSLSMLFEQGYLAPGATSEGVLSQSEIEVAVAMGAGDGDAVRVHGTPGADFWRLGTKGGTRGIDLNPGASSLGLDVDVTLQGVEDLALRGAGGTSRFDGTGSAPFDQPFPTRVTMVGSQDGDDILRGGDGPDLIRGFAGADQLFGGPGTDDIVNDAGDDLLDGGPHTDRVVHVEISGGITVDLGRTEPQDTGSAGTDTFTALENLIGTSAADVLTGDAGPNAIVGLSGDDTITGGAGIDELLGGDGSDTIRSMDGEVDTADCGAGKDLFRADAFDVLLGCEAVEPAGAVDGDGGTPGTQPGGGQPSGETPGTQPGVNEQPDGAGVDGGDAPAGRVAAMLIGPSRVRVTRRGYARVRLTCPAEAAKRCRGKLTLTRRAGGTTRTLGSRRFSVGSGRTTTARVLIARRWRRVIAVQPRGLRVRARARAHDDRSISRTAQRLVRLRAPRA